MKTWISKLHGSEFKVMRLQDCSIPVSVVADNPEGIERYLRPLLDKSIAYNSDVENFGVVFLNVRRRPISMSIISNGTLDTLLVHPREVFKAAILMNAAAIVLFHNHPSGDCSPSEGDIKVTRDLIRAGQLLKIEVLDHVILGQSTPEKSKSYSSLRELGYFYA